MGWWHAALGDYHRSSAITFSDPVFLPLPVSMPLTQNTELAWAKGLAELQGPQSTPYMSA